LIPFAESSWCRTASLVLVRFDQPQDFHTPPAALAEMVGRRGQSKFIRICRPEHLPVEDGVVLFLQRMLADPSLSGSTAIPA
jgi:hypothetical protein